MPEDIVRLRGHHLLCMLSYRGEGYTPDFVDNFDSIVAKINAGATIEIVSGVDDICSSLRQGATATCAHANVCRTEKIKNRDRIALSDVSRALQMPMLKSGESFRVKKGEVRHLRNLFAHGAIRPACTGCQWHKFCSQIAADKFTGVKLLPQAVP